MQTSHNRDLSIDPGVSDSTLSINLQTVPASFDLSADWRVVLLFT